MECVPVWWICENHVGYRLESFIRRYVASSVWKMYMCSYERAAGLLTEIIRMVLEYNWENLVSLGPGCGVVGQDEWVWVGWSVAKSVGRRYNSKACRRDGSLSEQKIWWRCISHCNGANLRWGLNRSWSKCWKVALGWEKGDYGREKRKWRYGKRVDLKE